ncbi:serine--tRNA ligase [Pelagibius litoralis]|uniref:Serine--tRNA ligase n=1 Tax=Pelagibius litoralis TaxID=374515 RepID=A0A967CAN2_9PROT|nr:serine--tRNA ligase [Pelagibius litoralis]NIA67544.1 serine--tRNA ligase [Pelagibius litoralis]
MLDIKWIREEPQAFDAALKRRGLEPLADAVLALDARHREIQAELQAIQTRRNESSKAIGEAKRKGEDAAGLMEEVSGLKQKMADAEETERRFGAELTELLSGIPNPPLAEIPDGPDETANVCLREHLAPTEFAFEPKEHYELGEALGFLDFEAAAKLSGSRFVVMRGQIARLHRALAQFMIDLHTTEHGYEEVAPPLLVRDHVLYGTGQLPKFEEDQFRTTSDHWLIPTAEVPLTNLVAGEILEAEALPLRVTALTPCFRSEAGSAGRDTRGMLRQHQFEKVEMVSIAKPEESLQELERMVGCAEEVLKRLGLPYRVMVLSAGDIGFGAAKTYDVEVWLPGQKAYREISSCSNCGDFQARRMKARYRPTGEKGTRFVHSLNGSGVAVGRCLIAVMENYQQGNGTIVVPEVLRPYMGGLEIIGDHG